MPANPKALAVKKAAGVAANFTATETAYSKAVEARRRMIAECIRKGCTVGEVASIFGITKQRASMLNKLNNGNP